MHEDGRMESGQNLIQEPVDMGLVYRVQDVTAGALPWDRPPLPHYMWEEVERSTVEVRRQIAEEHDNSVMREGLDGLFEDLSETMARHPEWLLPEQQAYLLGRWVECDRTERGMEARRIIERYIRENYPEMSLPEPPLGDSL
jgi:hypothetical protein